MATERIDSIIDVPAVQAEYEKLQGFLNELVASMEKVANSKLGAAGQASGISGIQNAVTDLTQSTAHLAQQQEKLVSQAQTIVNTAKQQVQSSAQLSASVQQHTGSLEENIRMQIQFTKQLNDNKTMQKELQAAFAASKIGAEAFGQAQVILQKQQLELKSTLSQLNSTLRQQTQENQAVGSSYKELSAQLTLLRAAYRGLSADERTSAAGQGLISQITQLDQRLKAVDADMGIHVRNVGNYSGALRTLETALIDAKGQLQSLTEAGQQNSEAGQRASAEVALFTQLVAQQEHGFTSLSREIMAVGKALETMHEQGLDNTTAFKQLEEQFTNAKRELNEFRKNQQLLSSEAPKLQALTLAAKGLMGAYALGAGTSALFADGNERVEKELNKLVAIMTILQGLQEVHELLEKRSAIATIANGVAQGFKNFVMTGSIKATTAATAAVAENTVAEEVNTVATEENIAASEAQAVATDTVAASTATATAGMVAFRIALLATGIGAILLLISTAAAAMNIFGKSAKDIAKETADLAEVEKELNDIIIQQIETLNNSDQAYKKYYQNQLALSAAAGQDAYKQFALKKSLAAQEREDAQNTLNDLQARLGKESDLLANLELMQARKAEALAINKKALEDDDKRAQDASKNLIDMYGKQEDAAKSSYEAVHKAHEDLYTALQKDGQLDLEQQKFSNQEQAKLAYTTAKIVAEAHINANDLILENEKSTLAQRIAANRSNLAQQLAIIEAEKKEKLSDPSLTPNGRAIAEKEAGAAAVKARADMAEKLRKMNLEYWKRDMAAFMDIEKGKLEFSASSNEKIASDESRSLIDRITAYRAYEADQRKLIDQERDYKKLTENLTAKELEALEADHQNKLNELARAGAEQRRKYQKEIVETDDSRGKSNAATNYDRALALLDRSFEQRKISQAKYNEQKKKLDEEKAALELQIDIVTINRLIGLTQKGTKERYDLEKKLADDIAKLYDIDVKKAEQAAEKRIKSIEKIVKYEQEGAKIIQSLVDDSYTRQLNRIQLQEDANTKAKDKEIQDINASTLSQQDKAAKLIQVEEQSKVQQDELERNRRATQLRQAKFDRDAQVLEIIGNTFVAAAKAGFLTPDGIAIEAEGLITAALLAAKPLPRFEHGTQSAPGGWAWTDEKGPELYEEPSGKKYLGNEMPTLRYVPRGTKITPNDQIEQVLYQQMIRGTASLVMPERKDQSAKEIRALRGAIETQTRELKKVYSDVRPPVVIIKRDLKKDYIP